MATGEKARDNEGGRGRACGWTTRTKVPGEIGTREGYAKKEATTISQLGLAAGMASASMRVKVTHDGFHFLWVR